VCSYNGNIPRVHLFKDETDGFSWKQLRMWQFFPTYSGTSSKVDVLWVHSTGTSPSHKAFIFVAKCRLLGALRYLKQCVLLSVNKAFKLLPIGWHESSVFHVLMLLPRLLESLIIITTGIYGSSKAHIKFLLCVLQVAL